MQAQELLPLPEHENIGAEYNMPIGALQRGRSLPRPRLVLRSGEKVLLRPINTRVDDKYPTNAALTTMWNTGCQHGTKKKIITVPIDGSGYTRGKVKRYAFADGSFCHTPAEWRVFNIKRRRKYRNDYMRQRLGTVDPDNAKAKAQYKFHTCLPMTKVAEGILEYQHRFPYSNKFGQQKRTKCMSYPDYQHFVQRTIVNDDTLDNDGAFDRLNKKNGFYDFPNRGKDQTANGNGDSGDEDDGDDDNENDDDNLLLFRNRNPYTVQNGPGAAVVPGAGVVPGPGAGVVPVPGAGVVPGPGAGVVPGPGRGRVTRSSAAREASAAAAAGPVRGRVHVTRASAAREARAASHIPMTRASARAASEASKGPKKGEQTKSKKGGKKRKGKKTKKNKLL